MSRRGKLCIETPNPRVSAEELRALWEEPIPVRIAALPDPVLPALARLAVRSGC